MSNHLFFARHNARRRAIVFCGTAVAIGALLAGTQGSFFDDILRSPTGIAEGLGAESRSMAGPSAAGFAGLARAVAPAVVTIAARAVDEDAVQRSHAIGAPYDAPRPRSGTSLGSGFFISADGYAVTNDHVVNGSTVAEVRLDDGKVYKARVVGTDRASDLALLKVDGRDDFAHVRFADKSPNVGDWIITVGNPYGLRGTVTAGIVSAQGRDVAKSAVSANYQDLIQIDAPVNKGNSGGPTFDLAGNVVGVNSIIFSPTGGSIGIAFAITAEKAKSVIDQLKEKGVVTRGWLGMQFQSVSPEIADSLELAKAAGVLVADIVPNGPAADAGLATGDVLTSVDGETLKDSHQLARILDRTAPGAVVVLETVHQGQSRTVAVSISQQAPAQLPPTSQPDKVGQPPRHLGLRLAPAGANGSHTSTGPGAVVMAIDPAGLAAGHGIDLGDVILDVANQAVESPDDVDRLVTNAQGAGKQSVLVRVRSGETTQFIPLPLS
jgi:serine protease Do